MYRPPCLAPTGAAPRPNSTYSSPIFVRVTNLSMSGRIYRATFCPVPCPYGSHAGYFRERGAESPPSLSFSLCLPSRKQQLLDEGTGEIGTKGENERTGGGERILLFSFSWTKMNRNAVLFDRVFRKIKRRL